MTTSTTAIIASVPWAVVLPVATACLLAAAMVLARSATRLSAAGICRALGARPLGGLEAPPWTDGARRLAARAGVPHTSVWVAPAAQANLFALADGPNTVRLVLTSGALDCLEPDLVDAALGMALARARRPDLRLATLGAGVGLAGSTMASFGFIGADQAEDQPVSWPLGVPFVLAGVVLARVIGGRAPGHETDLLGARLSGRSREAARLLEHMEFTAHQAPLSVSAALSRLALVDPRGEVGPLSLRRLFPAPSPSAPRAALLRSLGSTPDTPERAQAA